MFAGLLGVLAVVGQPCGAEVRQLTVASEPAIELYVLSARAPGVPRLGAVVLMHGAGAGGSSVYDLDFRDYSLIRHLACAGYDAYAFDARGFGGSTKPEAMKVSSSAHPPVVRAADAVVDLAAVVAYARGRSGVERVDLFGWSWGVVVAGLYAGTAPDVVRRLVLYAPVYDRKNPKRHRTTGAWREVERSKLIKYFSKDREEWGVWEEHIGRMFQFAPSGRLRLPNGPYRDIYGPDAPIWDASLVRADTLVIRGGRDRASLRDSAMRLYDALEGARSRRYLEIADANHFLMRELGYRELQGHLVAFLSGPSRVEPGLSTVRTSTAARAPRRR